MRSHGCWYRWGNQATSWLRTCFRIPIYWKRGLLVRASIASVLLSQLTATLSHLRQQAFPKMNTRSSCDCQQRPLCAIWRNHFDFIELFLQIFCVSLVRTDAGNYNLQNGIVQMPSACRCHDCGKALAQFLSVVSQLMVH